tara:strand:+ start:371 stop:724 length:354 start_codon:yes stop_codon:yes gene_type:complete
MANTFKNATAQKVDTSFVTVYDANAANLTATVVLGAALCNRTTGTIKVSCVLRVGGTDGSSDANHRLILNDVQILSGATLEVMSGQKYILQANDDLQFKSDTANSLDVVMGVMEITS